MWNLIIWFLILLAFVFIPVYTTLGLIKPKASKIELTIGTLYLLSIGGFILGLGGHSLPYYEAVDPNKDNCYSPFSEKDLLTIQFYLLTFNLSILLLWIKSKVLPPLTLTLSMIFVVLGIIINSIILFQMSEHDLGGLNKSASMDFSEIIYIAPGLGIIIGVILLYQVMVLEINNSKERQYSNKILNGLNSFLLTKSREPVWIILLMFPVSIIITMILILFGQDVDSIVKAFTETSTWKLSQKAHPPPLVVDSSGHYLCTVAAKGSPEIVKPVRFGLRHGKKIIVNRQLLIANAFEELISDFSPQMHRRIRKNYDKYGYNLSKKINTVRLSNITYVLMKPLEWFFLICLYLFCKKPEDKINRQYSL